MTGNLAGRSFRVPGLGLFRINVFRLIWRSAYVVLTTMLAALFPARPPVQPTLHPLAAGVAAPTV